MPWLARIVTLIHADGHGGREALVKEAGSVLDADELHALGQAVKQVRPATQGNASF